MWWLHPGTWLALIGGTFALLVSLWGWGHHRYNEGVADKQHAYEIAAAKADGEFAAKSKQQFTQAEHAVEKFDAKTKARDLELARRKGDVAARDVLIGELRSQLASRGEAAAQSDQACSVERERIRSAEDLLVAGAERVASCNRALAEGQTVLGRVSDKLGLAGEFIDALNAGQ